MTRYCAPYTVEKAIEICNLIADGESLRKICERKDMPNRSSVFEWLRTHPEFVVMYNVARDDQADGVFDEVMDIADDGRNDWMESNDPKNLGYKFNSEHVQRTRVRIDTRKWVLACMNAKKYGSKVDVTSAGGPLTVAIVDPRRKAEKGED
jgi:hypothetical protein